MMDAILDLLPDMSSDNPTVMLSLLVFLAAGTLAFGVMAAIHVRGAVKRRTAGVVVGGTDRSDDKPRRSSTTRRTTIRPAMKATRSNCASG